MINIILKFGLLSGGIIVLIPLISGFFMGYGAETFAIAEVIGYVNMVLSLSLIFFGMQSYKSTYVNGYVGFNTLFRIGLGISFIAGVMFGFYNVVHVIVIDPEFMERYYAYSISNIQSAEMSQALIDQKVAEMEEQKAMFMNPLVNFLAMFTTVFVIGLLVTVFSGLIQRDKYAK